MVEGRNGFTISKSHDRLSNCVLRTNVNISAPLPRIDPNYDICTRTWSKFTRGFIQFSTHEKSLRGIIFLVKVGLYNGLCLFTGNVKSMWMSLVLIVHA